MSFQRQTLIRCDFCGNKYDWAFEATDLVAEIRATVAESGWERRGQKDICPECVVEQEAETPVSEFR